MGELMPPPLALGKRPTLLTHVEDFFGIDGHTTADITGLNPEQTKVASTGATLENAGALATLFGTMSSAIGSFYAAKTQQYQTQAQASSLGFQSNMDAINSRVAEMSAQSIEEAGKTQVMQYTMRAEQEAAADQVSTAARGVDLSSESAVAERASRDLVKQVDVNNIEANATRAAWTQRATATNYSNESLLASTSANNLRASSDSVSPTLGLTTSLLSSAGRIASQWDWRRRVAAA